MRKIIIIIVLLSVVVGSVYGIYYYQREALPEGRRLYVGDAVVVIEIADNAQAWEKGLSGRESLGRNQGVLFIFPYSRKQSFWMKEMKFPIDILFIQSDRVAEIFENVPAPDQGQDGTEIRAVSKNAVNRVLEVNSGWVEKFGVEVGDTVQLIKVQTE